MPRPTVLQVVLSLNPGGAERLTVDLCRRLRGEFSFAVCCLDEAGVWAGQLQDEGVPVFSLSRKPGFHPLLARRVADVARGTGATVLHCHEYSSFVYGTLAQIFRPSLRVVSTEHGRLSDAPAGFKRRLGTRVVTRLPADVYAVCHDLRGRLIEDGFPPDRVRVIHNGIEPGAEPTDEDRRRARTALQLGADDLVVGAVGRLAAVKDFGTLLDALVIARRRLPARLVIVGDGPERAALLQRAQDAGVVEAVMMTGHRDDVRSLLPAFDVFASSSVYEGVSLTILEAMAAGLPVVATRVGGTPEVVDDGATGVLVEPRSASALAEALGSLLTDADRRATFGVRGRQRVVEAFHIDRMAGAYAAAYRSLRDDK